MKMTDGELTKQSKVIRMSFPIFMELFLQLLVGNLDQLMVSQYSQNSVAAIGNCNQVMNIVIIGLNVMSMATTILLAQCIGGQNREKISKVCSVSIALITVISLITTIIIMIFCQSFFIFLKVPQEIIGEACLYLRVVGGAIIISGLYLNLASMLRSFTFMKEVMFVAIIMNVLNVIGNAILINGWLGFPRLGILGAAISTDISKCVGLIIVIILFIKKVDIKISMKELTPFPVQTLKKMLYIGVPSGGEEMSYHISQMCIMKFINIFGTSVITTKIYCSMLVSIAYVYAMAISQATQIVISYLIGAGKKEEVDKKVWMTTSISLAVCLLITFLLYMNCDAIFRLFTDDPKVHELGKKILFIEFFLEIGRAVNIVMTRALIACGEVKTPVTVGLICMWFLAVGLSYLFGVIMEFGLMGIWIAMTIDECVRAFIFILLFKRGTWKRKDMFL